VPTPGGVSVAFPQSQCVTERAELRKRTGHSHSRPSDSASPLSRLRMCQRSVLSGGFRSPMMNFSKKTRQPYIPSANSSHLLGSPDDAGRTIENWRLAIPVFDVTLKSVSEQDSL